MGAASMRLLHEIKSCCLYPTTTSYNAAVLSCSSSTQVERALGLLADMHVHAVERDAQVYGRLLMECEQGSLLSHQVSILQSLSSLIKVPDLHDGSGLHTAAEVAAITQLISDGW